MNPARRFLALALFILVAFLPSRAFCQLVLQKDKVFVASDVDVFKAALYDAAVTRQNSCTLTLTDFQATEVKEGQFLLLLSVKFQQQTGAADPITKDELRFLFDDVIKAPDGPGPAVLSLKNKRLASNVILSEVDNVSVQVRLIKVKDNYADFMKLVQPILGVSITGRPAFQLVDNLLQTISTGDPDQLLSSSDYYVPSNVFEYKRLKDGVGTLLLENELPYGITLKGAAAIPNDSILGKASAGLNVVTRFLVGKSVVKPETAQYSGFVRLFFTKNAVPVLPAGLAERLQEIDTIVSSGSADADALDANSKFVTTLASTLFQGKQIDRQTQFSIAEYLKLARLYVMQQEGDSKYPGWRDRFDTWSTFFDTKGAAVGGQAIGIAGIYDDATKVAKIYLPYSLPDDLIMSFYLWQVAIHKQFKTQSDLRLAVKRPT